MWVSDAIRKVSVTKQNDGKPLRERVIETPHGPTACIYSFSYLLPLSLLYNKVTVIIVACQLSSYFFKGSVGIRGVRVS